MLFFFFLNIFTAVDAEHSQQQCCTFICQRRFPLSMAGVAHLAGAAYTAVTPSVLPPPPQLWLGRGLCRGPGAAHFTASLP